MSSSELAVSVRGLGKTYTIAHNAQRHTTLGEAALAMLRSPLRRQKTERFKALSDVSFDINQGEIIGIIGRNGAGKSTLLKILSRITDPTNGEIDIYGRVGSLLEVGTGFHPELTGRENIFLNGAILGMTKAEIRRQFDAIVDFAGAEQFLDTPVKRYSSGMYVRLAFAVAAHLESEILIVDEVLAVGDAEFQNKCMGKVRDVSSNGRTVLLVSHQLETVTKLCTAAIVLERGRIVANGPADESVSLYLSRSRTLARRPIDSWDTDAPIDLNVELPDGIDVDPDQEKRIRFHVRTFHDPDHPWFVSGLIRNDRGEAIVQFDSRLVRKWFSRVPRGTIDITIRHPWLRPGNYTIDAFVCIEGKVVCERLDCAEFVVAPKLPYPAAADGGAFKYVPVLTDFSVSEIRSD